MRVRILIIAGTIVLALGLVGMALALAQSATPGQAQPDAESSREAELAVAAEQSPALAPLSAVQITTPLVISAPLFIGVDNVAQFAYLVDPETGDNHRFFKGFEIWAAAHDAENDRLFFVSGTNLYQRSGDGVVEALGSIKSTDGINILSMVGLTYADGVLYGSRSITSAGDPEGLYAIDPDTLVASHVASFVPAAAFDIGGLGYDERTGKLYGVNDGVQDQGLVEIGLTGVITPIAPYPDGHSDVDGLDIGGGRAYLIHDEPGFIYVYDFATMTYTLPITNPWTTEEVFAGGAWISGPGPTYLPVVAGSPLLEP